MSSILERRCSKQYLYYPANKETNEVKLMEEYYCENGLKNGKWKQYFKLGLLSQKEL